MATNPAGCTIHTGQAFLSMDLGSSVIRPRRRYLLLIVLWAGCAASERLEAPAASPAGAPAAAPAAPVAERLQDADPPQPETEPRDSGPETAVPDDDDRGADSTDAAAPSDAAVVADPKPLASR